MVEQGETSKVESQATLFQENNRIHGYRLKESYTLERICEGLESNGYEVQSLLIPACAVGAPHRRDRVFIVGHLTYTNSKRCRRRTETDKGKENNLQQTLFSNSKRYGSRASFADANRELQQPRHNINEKRQEKTEMRPVKFTCGDNSKAGCGRWENFPIVAPVHRGNDGLPISLDDLTISKTKWREESIKAYGNAIEPQVIFEIYRAIDQVEREGH